MSSNTSTTTSSSGIFSTTFTSQQDVFGASSASSGFGTSPITHTGSTMFGSSQEKVNFNPSRSSVFMGSSANFDSANQQAKTSVFGSTQQNKAGVFGKIPLGQSFVFGKSSSSSFGIASSKAASSQSIFINNPSGVEQKPSRSFHGGSSFATSSSGKPSSSIFMSQAVSTAQNPLTSTQGLSSFSSSRIPDLSGGIQGTSSQPASSIFMANPSSTGQNPLSNVIIKPSLVFGSPSLGISSSETPTLPEAGNKKKRSLDAEAPAQSSFISSSAEQRDEEFGGPSKRRSFQANVFGKQVIQKSSADSTQGSGNLFLKRQADKSPTTKLRPRRLSSSTDQAAVSQSFAIVCLDVPPDMMSRERLRHHFSRFGNVLRINLNAEKKTATVAFRSHEDAARAKAEGEVTLQGRAPLKIYFKKMTRKSTEAIPVGKDPPPSTGFLRQMLMKPAAKMPLSKAHQPLTRMSSRKSVAKIQDRMTRAVFAKTDEEKLQILEKIDSLLRKRVVRQSDLRKAITSKGTCPDMCPEKERYLRQQRKLLHSYEMDENGYVDHRRAIKEYSRSSADQEEPLPHELRPSHVLRTTMYFIFTDIIPKVEGGQVADWYDFVWNRTRAIRKELTIQQINDPAAAEINEQCARFHILCSHHFCEEDRMVFDPKINNENLEKTMKTILDLYREIYLTGQEESDDKVLLNSNVAELYSYYILLNINRTADVLYELQDLPCVVRSSPLVKLAVQAFYAVQNNNYAKFFKTVREASYLQGCLLHRYFSQVRRKAILTIARSFVQMTGKKTVVFPVSSLARVLCFNDMNELSMFCDYHSIWIRDDVVELQRSGYEEQETAMLEVRSNLVTSKISNRSLGEIVANCDVSTRKIHEPYSSFDEDGRYIGEHASLLSSDKQTQAASQVQSAGSFQGFSEVKTRSPDEMKTVHVKLPTGVTNVDVKIIAKDLFHEVISELVLELSKTTHQVAQDLIQCRVIMNDVINDVIINDSMTIANDVVKQEVAEKKARIAAELALQKKMEEDRKLKEKKEREQKEERERMEREKEVSRRKQSEVIASRLESEVIDDIIKAVAMETYKAEKELLWQRRIEKISSDEFDSILNDNIAIWALKLSKETLSELRNQKHEQIFLEIQTCKLERCFERWKKAKEAKIKFQVMKRTFPGMPHCRPIKYQIRNLVTNEEACFKENSFLLDGQAELSLRSPMSIVGSRERREQQVSDSVAKLTDMYVEASKPLKFCDIISEMRSGVVSDQASSVIWKILLYGPQARDGDLCNWVYKRFLGDEKQMKKYKNVVTSDTGSKGKIKVCCSRQKECFSREAVMGSSGIVYLLPAPGTYPKDDFWMTAKMEFESLMSSIPEIPSLPLLIFTLDWDLEGEDIVACLGLEESLVSHHKVIQLIAGSEHILENDRKMQVGVRYLVQFSPNPPTLISQSFKEFFEDELGSRYVTPLYKHLAQRQELDMRPLEASFQVNFYNCVVENLAAITNHRDYANISWPAPEFKSENDITSADWNRETRLVSNYRDMIKCRIANFPEIPAEADENEILNILLKYSEKICPSSPQLQSIIRQKFEIECETHYDTINLDACDYESSLTQSVNFHQIVDAIISRHLTNLLYNSDFGCRVLTYPHDATDLFSIPNYFTETLEATDFFISDVETPARFTRKRQEKGEARKSETGKSEDVIGSRVVDVSWMYEEPPMLDVEKKTNEFLADVEEEKKLSNDFEEKLLTLIMEGELSSTLGNVTLPRYHVSSFG